MLFFKSTTTMMMIGTTKSSIFTAITINTIVLVLFSLIKHTNAGAYDLPAGTLKQTGLTELKRTFKCEAEGYFADVDNECKIYHQCNSFNSKKGSPNIKYAQTTMACGENQIFDQSKFACKDESDAIPCEASSDFFYLNERIGDETADFLTDADIEKAQAARPEYRAAARARAKRRRAISKLKKRRSTTSRADQNQPQPYPVLVDDLNTASSNIDGKVIITSPKLIKITKPSSPSSSESSKSSSTKSKFKPSKSKQTSSSSSSSSSARAKKLLKKMKKLKKKRNTINQQQQQQEQKKSELSKILVIKMNR